jgi:hypothetical protein
MKSIPHKCPTERCAKTGHPVGTDTVAVGEICGCGPCQQYEIDRLKGWGAIEKHYTLHGRRLVGGQVVEIRLGERVLTGRIIVTRQEHRGRGGMDESWSWEVLYLRTELHGVDVDIVVKESMAARSWVGNGGLVFVSG